MRRGGRESEAETLRTVLSSHSICCGKEWGLGQKKTHVPCTIIIAQDLGPANLHVDGSEPIHYAPRE